MHGLGERWFWCPRCGTILSSEDREHTISQPKSTNQTRAWLLTKYATEESARNVLSELVLAPSERD